MAVSIYLHLQREQPPVSVRVPPGHTLTRAHAMLRTQPAKYSLDPGFEVEHVTLCASEKVVTRGAGGSVESFRLADSFFFDLKRVIVRGGEHFHPVQVVRLAHIIHQEERNALAKKLSATGRKLPTKQKPPPTEPVMLESLGVSRAVVKFLQAQIDADKDIPPEMATVDFVRPGSELLGAQDLVSQWRQLGDMSGPGIVQKVAKARNKYSQERVQLEDRVMVQRPDFVSWTHATVTPRGVLLHFKLHQDPEKIYNFRVGARKKEARTVSAGGPHNQTATAEGTETSNDTKKSKWMQDFL